jgi:hypothetical protein
MSTLKDQLALCDTLRAAQMTANALDDKHAWQSSTYGAIGEALIVALIVTLEADAQANPAVLAEWIYNVSVESGEDITYAWQHVMNEIAVEAALDATGA